MDVSAVDQEHIAQWLMDTTGSQESAVQAATSHLEAAQSVPKFGLFLLMLSAGLFFSQLSSPRNALSQGNHRVYTLG